MAVTSGRGVATGRAQADVTSGRNANDVSQREDLANFISMITRDETPFMSSIGKTKATAIFHEWQTDSLEAPGDSKISEGTDYVIPGSSASLAGGTDPNGGNVTNSVNVFNPIGPFRSRLGNYAQINGKTIAVSGTRRAIDQAGVADEYAYQLKKRGTELRRDLERDLVHTYQAANANSGQRSFGGFQSFINVADPTVATETARTTTGQSQAANREGDFIGSQQGGTVLLNNATGATTEGVGTASPTLTADRVALSLSDIDEVMQRIYQEGGKATKIMLSPKLRRDFSDLIVTDSGVRRNIDEKGKLRQSVDIYMSDFGDLMVVPNYVMGLDNVQAASGNVPATGNPLARTAPTAANNTADSCALIYDPMWFSVATLRPLQEVDVGQRGDSTIGMLVEECTLEVKNPIGCGAIYNLN